MNARRVETELLVQAGRLLLEYDESTGEIHRALTRTARVLTDEPCTVAVAYGGVTISLGDDGPVLAPVHELRYNTALQSRVHSVLHQVRHGELEPAAAVTRLEGLEADTPRHPRWVAVPLLGIAAAALACILGADAGAAAVAGVATGLGLWARQGLGRQHFPLLTLPLTAAFIGAVLGGLAIHWIPKWTGTPWTGTPGLVLIVPSLMLVPGPHLINGLLDLIDNYLPMSLARLGLATGILLACGLGIILGMELTLPELPVGESAANTDHLNVVTDMLLAGIVTCGFAVFYNATWAQVAMAAVGGMAGHGLRFLTKEAGAWPEAATLLGGLAVGAVSAWIARRSRTPVAVIAFAGAVTMMPGLQIFRALGGAVQLARLKQDADLASLAETLGNAAHAFLVVAALSVGLVVGARVVLTLTSRRDHPAPPAKRPGNREEPAGAVSVTR